MAGLSALPAGAQTALPPELAQALRRARLPESALVAVVQELAVPGTAPAGSDAAPARLRWNEQLPVNPASVFKLATTAAALDLLGPAYTWSTPVYATGPLREGVLEGSLVIRGSGDPKLVLERVWLLLRRLRQLGLREIRGDLVLDRSAFAVPEAAPGDFDGESLRPYNVRPDALLLNFKSQMLSFTPDPARGVALVGVEPALAGVAVDATVPLATGPCEDWRGALKLRSEDPGRVRFTGAYPASCGEQVWPLAYADPRSYNARLLEQIWAELGGRLQGSVREGLAPAGLKPLAQSISPALAEVVRDINKFSNNVMADQLFLSLALAQRGSATAFAPAVPASTAAGRSGPVTPDEARELLARWLRERLGEFSPRELVIDNGSGLSRETRISARLLARLLQQIWAGPTMPELLSSLPVTGLDGTMRRSQAPAGRAHLKTGTLKDVSAIAGYVLADSGRRYLVVGILNHKEAPAGRPVLDALIQWALRDRLGPSAPSLSAAPG